MAEFLIRRNGNPNAKGFQRGDIVEVQADGYFADKPYMTVLKVSNLPANKVRKLMNRRDAWKDVTFTMEKRRWQKIKAKLKNEEIMDNIESVLDMEFKDVSIENDGGDTVTVTCKRLVEGQPRRFFFPGPVMAALFPDGVYHREVSRAQFISNLDKIRDRGEGNVKLTDTVWYSNFKAGL